MRGIEQHLTEMLALQCQKRIAQAREELDNHQLLLSRFIDAASEGAFATVFNIQLRSIETPLHDGLSPEIERPMLDMLHAQTLHMQQAGSELAQLRGALDDRRLIERAKWLLVSQQGLSEQAAHERLLHLAMDHGIVLGEAAWQILSSEGLA